LTQINCTIAANGCNVGASYQFTFGITSAF
jgi:hypothetical protein